MSMKYKLVRKVNPTKKKKQWYAIPQYVLRQAGDMTLKRVAHNTTFSTSELNCALGLLGEYIPYALADGRTVKIPGVGSLRLSFRSTGVDDIRDFNSRTMIGGLHIVFTPEAEAMRIIRREAQITLGSVKDERGRYPTIAAYLKANGLNEKGE